MRALAQHRFGKVEAMAHGGLHCTAMRLVKGMHDLSHSTLTQLAYCKHTRQSTATGPLLADSVAKVESCVGPNFLVKP
jgi:hypothetical protein